MTNLLEAQALGGLDSHLHEFLLLLGRQDAGAIAAGLVEIGLYSRPVICDGAIYSLAFTEDHINVHLRSIQVLLQHQCQLDPAVCIALHTSATATS